MTRLFVLHADADAACADRLALDLTTSGYHVDKDVQAFNANGELQPYTPKLNLVGCATIIALWSGDAPQAETVRNALQFAQGMHKYIVTVALDNVLVPAALQTSHVVTSSSAVCDTLAALLAPHLPPAQNADPLLTIYEDAIDASAPVRKEAIARAEAMLKQGQHRKEVSALLEILASDDTITSVSDAAAEVISRTKNTVPTPPANSVPQQTQNSSLFSATCGNGHTTTFDKHDVCSHTGDTVYRFTDVVSGGNTTRSSKQSGPRIEEVYLTCPVDGCGLSIYKKIDCAGY